MGQLVLTAVATMREGGAVVVVARQKRGRASSHSHTKTKNIILARRQTTTPNGATPTKQRVNGAIAHAARVGPLRMLASESGVDQRHCNVLIRWRVPELYS